MIVAELAPEADDDTVALFATYAIAAADGLFLARQTRGDRVDLERLFTPHARIVIEAIARHVPPGGPHPPTAKFAPS